MLRLDSDESTGLAPPLPHKTKQKCEASDCFAGVWETFSEAAEVVAAGLLLP